MNLVKNFFSHERHHKPSHHEGIMKMPITLNSASTTKNNDFGAPLMGVFSCPKKEIRKFYYFAPFILQNLFFVFFLPLYKFFMRLEIVGQENLNNISGSILLAANHTSELDPTVIPLALPFLSNSSPIYSVIYPFKKYKTPDFGWRKYVYGQFFFNILAGYPVYSGYKDYESSLKDHILLLKSGRTVCIFPEGKCTVDGKIAPAHGGLGFLTFETKATVVPLAINTFYGLTFFDFLLRRKKLTVTILPPMSTDELISTNSPTVEDFRAAGEKVLEKIKKKLEK